MTFKNDFLFPKMMIAREFKDLFLAEITGLSKTFQNLSVKKSDGGVIDQYFSLFRNENESNLFIVNRPIDLQNICFANSKDLEEARKRFPFAGLAKTQVFIGDDRNLLSLGPGCTSVILDNITLVSRSTDAFRCKEIMAATIVPRQTKATQLRDFYADNLNAPRGHGTFKLRFVTSTQSSNEAAIKLAMQLQNLYLSPDIRETTIGHFFNLHPELIKQAFKTTHYEYEPYLKWVEHDGAIEEEAINPDLMVRRDDGYYNIYDLKTAALGKRSITKASSSRRRFIDYVCEGVAQLGNYAEYFTFPENAAFAKGKYGIQVKDPNLVHWRVQKIHHRHAPGIRECQPA